MSFEITPMRNRVLPIALGAAVAVVSLGAIAIPAANAQPMVMVRPARHHHHHHRGGWNVPPAAATMACLLYTSPSPRDRTRSRMPSSA